MFAVIDPRNTLHLHVCSSSLHIDHESENHLNTVHEYIFSIEDVRHMLIKQYSQDSNFINLIVFLTFPHKQSADFDFSMTCTLMPTLHIK